MIGSAMGKCPTKGFVVKSSYMVHVAPQHYTGMRHLTPKRMIPDAASAFIYYDIATCFDRSGVFERSQKDIDRYSGANDQITSKAQGAGSR
jgi:hypothetical protein